MQGKQVVENTTRGGGADNTRQTGGQGCKPIGRRRTPRKVIGWPTTQQEEEAKDTMQGNQAGRTQQEGGVEEARQLSGGGHNKRKGAEDPMLQWNTTTHQEGGSRKCEAHSLHWHPLVYDRFNGG
jgi:hypothetical protein